MKRMTEQEVEEELKKVLLGARNHGILDASEVSTDDMCVIGIRLIFNLFKQAGYVRLSEDQSLPPNPFFDMADAMKGIESPQFYHAQKAREDMLNNYFRKVEKEDLPSSKNGE